jgi:hypothetical protein
VTWPFVTRRVYDLELRQRDVQIDLTTFDRDYWKGKAERLIDNALVRAGAAHMPTMVDRPIPPGVDAASMITAAMAIQEIDSSKTKGRMS